MYRRVGTSAGPTPIADLAARAGPHFLSWAADGHATAHSGVLEAVCTDLEDAVPGEWQSAMLVGIAPGGSLVLHHDDLADEFSRYHVVLATSDRCWYFHDGDWQRLETGGIYYFDPTRDHAAINWGPEPRIHLVIDVKG